MRRSWIVRLVLVAFCVGVALDAAAQGRIRRRLRGEHGASAPAGVLTLNDLSCVAMFLGPQVESGEFAINMPTAVRLVGGVPHIFQFDGKANVYEYLIPTLTGNCSTPIGSLAQATVLQAWGAWPTMHSGASKGWTPRHPNTNATYTFGLKWDESTGWLVASTSSTYTNLLDGSNALHAVTLNSGSHTLDCAGEWGITGLKQSAVGTGIIDIPASFLSAYGLGSKRWGLGTGGYTSSGSNGVTSNSIGRAIRATDVPSGNACPDATDTDVAEGVTLVRHDINEIGPTCNGDDLALSGSDINCQPGSGTPSTSVAPTTPYPQKTAWQKYSLNYYRFSWDPYGGFGYVGAPTQMRSDWYKGGKEGLVTVFEMPSGSVNTPVLASPTPTVEGGCCTPPTNHITFSLSPAALAGDHYLQLGDRAWVQTCDPIDFVDSNAGCASANGRYLSHITITSINNSTGAVGATIDEPDFSVGSHLPIAGGHFYMGGAYVHAIPDNSRSVDIIQIVDPAQMGEVARLLTRGRPTRPPWDVIYNEEAQFSTFAAPFGCPGCATSGKPSAGLNAPSAVHALPSIQRILVAFKNGTIGIGVQQTLFVVLSAP